MDAQINEQMTDADQPAHLGIPAPRDALDREEQLIRDGVLLMGNWSMPPSARRAGRWSAMTRRSPSR